MPLSTKSKTRLQLSTNEWLSLLAIILVVIILAVNIVKVVSRAGDNYQVYIEEKAALGRLQQENAELERELAYYQSYEYKKLYARDNLRLADPGERLIQIVDNTVSYDEDQTETNILSTTDDNSVWWLMLL